jgi:tryptophan 2,3-dioxygenase
MGYQYKKAKPKKKAKSSKVVSVIILVLLLGVAAKFTPLLSMLGITTVDQPADEKDSKAKKKAFDLSAVLEKQSAANKIMAERAAQQRAIEEADRQRNHQAEVERKKAIDEAFNAWYKPSEDCKNKSGKWEIVVRCGNEYIAAQKYFMEHHPKP